MKPEEPQGVPALVMLREHYNRLVRLLDRRPRRRAGGRRRRRASTTTTCLGYNTLAEIPGQRQEGRVRHGGRPLDSWHGGPARPTTAPGVAVVMEAARILKATRRQAAADDPLRALDRRGAVEALGIGVVRPAALRLARAAPKDPEDEATLDLRPPEEPGTAHAEARARPCSPAYFNLDNGTGKIRGIYAAGERRHRPDLRGVAAATRRPGCDHRDPAEDRGHRPRAVRRGRPARLPVHPGRRRVLDAHLAHQPRRLRPAEARRPDAGVGRAGELPVRRRDARRDACRASRCRSILEHDRRTHPGHQGAAAAEGHERARARSSAASSCPTSTSPRRSRRARWRPTATSPRRCARWSSTSRSSSATS